MMRQGRIGRKRQGGFIRDDEAGANWQEAAGGGFVRDDEAGANWLEVTGGTDLLKVVGGCMIFGGCFGLGLWYREQLNGRIKALRHLKNILELLDSEVRYGRASLPECCMHIARYLSAPFAEAFLEIGRRMEENTGGTFEEIFQAEMKQVLAELPLKDEDREDFLQFTVQTGFADGQMQLRSIEQGIAMLGATEEKLLEENAEKGRMAVGLGAMSGLLLILILI